MTRSDDLAPLIGPPGGDSLSFGQGRVLTWNPITAENTVEYRGSVLTDLPILNTSEALLLQPGAIVGIQRWRGSYFIVGRITVPGSADAATALDAIATKSATVTDFQETTSTSYTDLSTAGPEVEATVGVSGRCLVFVTATIYAGGTRRIDGFMSFVTSDGAVTANDSRALNIGTGVLLDGQVPQINFKATRLVLLTGLATGPRAFTAKYRAASTGGSGDGAAFDNRNITVVPL